MNRTLDPVYAVVATPRLAWFGRRREVTTRQLEMLNPIDLFEAMATEAGAGGEIVLVVPNVPTQARLDGWREATLADYMRPAEPIAEFGQLAKELVAAGWIATDGSLAYGVEQGWSSWVRGIGQHATRVHLCVMAWHNGPRRDQPLVDYEQRPERIAANLASFHSLTGVAWRGNAGPTCHQFLRQEFDRPPAPQPSGAGRHPAPAGRGRKEPLWRLPPDRDRPTRGVGDLVWSRPMTAAERRSCPVVAVFDMRAAYLAAWSAATYAWGDLEPGGAAPFDPARYGMYRIVVPRSGAWWVVHKDRPPLISPARIGTNRTTWVSTSTMALLLELRAKPEIADAWLATEEPPADQPNRPAGSGRVLRVPAERLRDIRITSAAPDPVKDAVKLLYAVGSGYMASESGRIYRPDWHVETEDRARSMVYRKMRAAAAAGFGWPLKVDTDCVWYPLEQTGETLQKLCIALGAGKMLNGKYMTDPLIGKFRHEGTIAMDEYVKGSK